MQHAPKWMLTALLFALLLPVASVAQTEEALILVAAKDSRVKAQAWIDFLKRYDLTVEHFVLSELQTVKSHDFIAIMGGLDETGFKDLLAGIIGEAELASLEAKGAQKMFLKENVWKPGQKVLIFAGNDVESAAAARSESKEEWMEYLTEWFDLEEIPGGLRAY